MSWQQKRVIVIGAGGFIGSHLAERLVKEGASVRAMVHYRGDGSRGWLDSSDFVGDMEIVAGDVRDRDFMVGVLHGQEVIFHLAAIVGIPYSYLAPRSYIETNIGGTVNVLQAARDAGVQRVVHTSTSEVYGSAQRAFMDELHPICAQSPYSATKIAADKMAESFHRSFGLSTVTVRPFNTFGPRQSARAIIPTIIAQLLQGPQLLKLGNLDPTRDLNYVSNTIDGFLLAGSVPGVEGRVINIGSGRETSIGDLAEMIGRMVPEMRRQPLVTVQSQTERMRPESSEVNRLCCDNTLARSLLGWEPRVSLEEGIERTIEWMRENQGRYRANEYAV